MDQGYLTENGLIANKEPVKKLLELERTSDLKLATSLPKNALDVAGAQLQKVKTTAKLLSN